MGGKLQLRSHLWEKKSKELCSPFSASARCLSHLFVTSSLHTDKWNWMWMNLPCFSGGFGGQCWAQYCSQTAVWIPLLGAEKPQVYHCIAQRDGTRLQSSVWLPCECECVVRFLRGLAPSHYRCKWLSYLVLHKTVLIEVLSI